MLPILDLHRSCPDITKEAARGLHDLAELLGTASIEVGKTLFALRKEVRGVVSNRTLASLTADMLDGVYLAEAGFTRAKQHRGEPLKGGQKLYEYPGCDARFKVISSSRGDRLHFATNAGRHLQGAYFVAYHRVLDLKGKQAGVDALWLFKAGKVKDRKPSKKGGFGGNVGDIDTSEVYPLLVPTLAQVRSLAG